MEGLRNGSRVRKVWNLDVVDGEYLGKCRLIKSGEVPDDKLAVSAMPGFVETSAIDRIDGGTSCQGDLRDDDILRPPCQTQDSGRVGPPCGYRTLVDDTPRNNPAICVAGQNTVVRGREFDGMDLSGMAPEHVDWLEWREFLIRHDGLLMCDDGWNSAPPWTLDHRRYASTERSIGTRLLDPSCTLLTT